MGGDSDRPHVKSMKDPIEVHPPCPDLFFVVRRVKKVRDGISFTQSDDVPLDLRNGSAITGTINQLNTVHASVGPTHVVSSSIASNTDRLPTVHPPVKSPTDASAHQP